MGLVMQNMSKFETIRKVIDPILKSSYLQKAPLDLSIDIRKIHFIFELELRRETQRALAKRQSQNQ